VSFYSMYTPLVFINYSSEGRRWGAWRRCAWCQGFGSHETPSMVEYTSDGRRWGAWRRGINLDSSCFPAL
jgi:hypothetical protein